MQLELKPDFENTQERWNCYWQGLIQNRPMMKLLVLKEGIKPINLPHPYHIPRLDIYDIIERVRKWAMSYEWLADAVPSYRISFAPDHLALLLGADLEYQGQVSIDSTAETAWVHPILQDYDTEIKFIEDGKWWEQTVTAVREFRKELDGIMLITPPELQGGLDCLAALRGTQELLMDLIVCPDDVRNTLEQINQSQKMVHRALEKEFATETFGTVTRHGMYSTGNISIPQCDFSVMISPEMFQEFGLPSIQSECDYLDAAEYHLDGPDAIKHLPAIATVDKIKAIQWQPGAGEAETQDWSDLYREIDNYSKGQVRYNLDKDEVRACWQQYDSPYLYVDNVKGITDIAEAECFLGSF